MPELERLLDQRDQIEAAMKQILLEARDARGDLVRLRRYARQLEHLYQQFERLHGSILSAIPAENWDDQDESYFHFQDSHIDACTLLQVLMDAAPVIDAKPQRHRFIPPEANKPHARIKIPPVQEMKHPVPIPRVMEQPCTLTTRGSPPQYFPYPVRAAIDLKPAESQPTGIKSTKAPTPVHSVMPLRELDETTKLQMMDVPPEVSDVLPISKISSAARVTKCDKKPSTDTETETETSSKSTGTGLGDKPCLMSVDSRSIVNSSPMSAENSAVNKPALISVGASSMGNSFPMVAAIQSVVKPSMMSIGSRTMVKPHLMSVRAHMTIRSIQMPAETRSVGSPSSMSVRTRTTVTPLEMSAGIHPVGKSFLMSINSRSMVKSLPRSTRARSLGKPPLMCIGTDPMFKFLPVQSCSLTSSSSMSAGVSPGTHPTTKSAGTVLMVIKPALLSTGTRAAGNPFPTATGSCPAIVKPYLMSIAAYLLLKTAMMPASTQPTNFPFPMTAGLNPFPTLIRQQAKDPPDRVKLVVYFEIRFQRGGVCSVGKLSQTRQPGYFEYHGSCQLFVD